MNKKVNIYPKNPITSVNPTIRTTTLRVTKPVEDIRKCIIARAIVDEVLEDGSIVRLTLSNYDKDNSKTKIEKVAEQVKPVVEDIKEREEIVVEETETEEVVEEQPATPQQNNYQNNNFKHNKKNKNKFNNYQQQNNKPVEETVETVDVEDKPTDENK